MWTLPLIPVDTCKQDCNLQFNGSEASSVYRKCQLAFRRPNRAPVTRVSRLRSRAGRAIPRGCLCAQLYAVSLAVLVGCPQFTAPHRDCGKLFRHSVRVVSRLSQHRFVYSDSISLQCSQLSEAIVVCLGFVHFPLAPVIRTLRRGTVGFQPSLLSLFRSPRDCALCWFVSGRSGRTLVVT